MAMISSSVLSLFVVLLAVAIWFLLRRLRQSFEECDRLKAQLAMEAERLQTTIHMIREGIITTDAAGRIEVLNPVAEKFTGWHSQEAQGQLFAEVFSLIDQSTHESLDNILDRLISQGQLSSSLSHIILRSRDHSERLIESSMTFVRSAAGQIIGSITVFREATQMNLPIRQPLWQDQYDALTGLLNRQGFEHCLEQAIALSRRDDQEHSLCFLDLDHFREINNLAGFAVGDELLRQVSSLLQAKIRRADTVARLGGDEFAILLYRCPLKQADYVARSLTQMLEEFQFEYQGQTFSIKASIGLVPVAADSDAIDVLKAADLACATAKTENPGSVHLA